MQNMEIFFFICKNEKFCWQNFDYFNIFAQNIDYGYTLEPPWRDGSNEYPQSMLWIPLQTAVFLYTCKSGVQGYTFHGHVFLM